MHHKFFLLAVVVSSCLAAAPSQAALVLDQQGGTGASGGWGAPVIQSFTPAADNIAAVQVRVHGSGGPENDLTVEVYTGYDGSTLSGLIASAFVDDAARNTEHLATFTPVAVVPEQLYYLHFVLTQDAGETALTIGAAVLNPYARGAALDGGGNLFGGTADAVFSTFSESTFAVPAPAALPAGLIALAAMTARRRSVTRRKGVA